MSEVPMKVHTPNVDHQEFRADLIALMKKHTGKLNAAEALAIASHMVGQLVAMQDCRTMTLEMANAIIDMNIVQGNKEAVTNMLSNENQTRN